MTPVYLFTGFLEAGKTKAIQETMSDKRFHDGDRTILLLCEEGIEEFDTACFNGGNVHIEVVEDEKALSLAFLSELEKIGDFMINISQDLYKYKLKVS